MASGDSGVKKDAFAGYGANSATAANTLGQLSPIYSQLATGTVGLTPQQRADALTASMQSTGGSTAGAVGQGALVAARTGNAGGATAAIDDAARSGAVTDSTNALNTENLNTQIEQQNRNLGLSGLSNIYNSSLGAAQGYLGIANQAQRPFWQTALLQGMQSAGQAATGNLGG